jgi:hypothetical protein
MWVDKDDVSTDDNVWEFKASNPEAEVHIRSSIIAKSPYPPTPTQSQLLYHHALSCMSSDGNNDLAHEYTAGAVADSPIPFSSENAVNTPVTVPAPVIDFATLQPLNPVAPVFSPRPITASSSASDIAAMFQGLCVHTPAPLTPDSQCAARQANETVIILFSPAERRGSQASSSLEPRAATGSEGALGATTTAMHRQWSDSNGSATKHDLRQCT